MALTPGERLGAFDILSALGAGGMGEVYRARDTVLGREVAIKVLSPSIVADVDRLRRFEREARMLASLNHPNIAQIFGLDRQSHRADPENPVGPFIVMELVEGPTLEELITVGGRRPNSKGLSPHQALPIATQIADALGAAHDRGIVHRDIKPANIKITPTGVVKVLDFGLAKETAHATIMADDAATVTFAGTRAGMILGTAAYMSPEQARGQAVDTRSDIWAFGCVLYEMLTGRRAFASDTVADAMVAILQREPDWSALPTDVPPLVARLLHRCLEKDPLKRLRDIGDARHDLDDALVVARTATEASVVLAEAGQVRQSAPRRSVAREARVRTKYLVAALVLVALMIAGWVVRRGMGRTTESVAPILVDVGPATALLGSSPLERTAFGRMRPSRQAIALSPDGRTLAFTAHRDGVQQLYVRSLDRPEAEAVPDTQNADGPFFSPDGAWIGFWSAGALRKVLRTGGSIVKLCDATAVYGADWPDTGNIFFAQAGTIWRVPGNGGEPTQVTRLAVEKGDARHVLPHAVPGGEWLLFTSLSKVNDWDQTRVEAQALATGERKVVITGATDARYASTGHVLYMRLGDLDAAPFDVEHATLTGGEVTLVRDVMQSVNSTIAIALDTGTGQYAFSASGALAYVTGGVHQDMQGGVEWIRRDGTVEPIPTPLPVRPFFLPRVSPDGRSLIIGTLGLREQDLWRYEFSDHSLTRLTTEGRAEHALWSPDGTHLAFMSSRAGGFNVYVMRSDGGDAPVRLTTGPAEFPGAWTPDGRSLVIGDAGDISLIPVDHAASPQTLVATRFNERIPDLSPDGRWLTYVSNESGASEVYVRSFRDLGNKRRLSEGGGTEPAWSRNGKKLVFLSPRKTPQGDRLVVVEIDVSSGPTLSTGAPHTLFELDALHYTEASQARGFDMTPDASRFVFVHETYPGKTGTLGTIHYVERWFDELQRRVPVAR